MVPASVPVGAAAASAAAQGGAGLSAHSPAAASGSDIQAFQRLLSQPAAGAQPVSGGGLSEAVSEGLKMAADAYRSRFEALHAGLKRVEKTQSISSLLAWQLDSAKMGVEMEFTGKIVSKVVQDVEQLTKQQG